MKKRLTLVLILVLAVVMIGTALTYAGGRGFRSGGPRPRRGDGPFADLTEDQRNEIHQMVTDMKEAGASRAKIHETVGTMLHGFGVELPEDWDQHQGRRRGGFRLLCADLTDAQRISIREGDGNEHERGRSLSSRDPCGRR